MQLKNISRVLRILPKYSLVSLFCLIIDSSVYTSFVIADVPISVSAAFGYLSGLAVSYYILTRIGINDEKNKHFQKRAIFAITGVLGLVVTYFSALCTLQFLTSNPVSVKVISVTFSFFAVYVLRVKYVFK